MGCANRKTAATISPSVENLKRAVVSGRRPPKAARAAAISLRPANTISLRFATKLTTLPRNSSARKNRIKLLRENVESLTVIENMKAPVRENMRVLVRENMRAPVRENMRVLVMKASVRENMKAPVKENMKAKENPPPMYRSTMDRVMDRVTATTDPLMAMRVPRRKRRIIPSTTKNPTGAAKKKTQPQVAPKARSLRTRTKIKNLKKPVPDL